MNNNELVGVHYLIEVNQIDHAKFLTGEQFSEIFKNIISNNGGTIVNENHHNFDGNGTTLLLLLSESHFSIHTWPEYKYASIDLFTCGQKVNTSNIVKQIIDHFESTDYIVHKIDRGMKPNKNNIKLFYDINLNT